MRKITAVFILLALVLSLSAPTLALSPVVQHDYSTEANSGIRHQVCETLNGTSAHEYYTGDYTFETLSAQSGNELLLTLRQLMTDTHTYQSTYNDCRDLAVKTDCEHGDGTNISLLYSGYIATWEDWINNTSSGWNREHVWPKSLGGYGNEGAGADLHHIRPSDSSINGTRGNEKFGEVEGGKAVTGTAVTGNALGGYSNNTYFEPLDDMKGDMARICLYVHVRYGSQYSQCADITNVFQSIDVLLDWCASDPVDTWEMGRNEVVGAIQGNRNVFIDYPELAWLIFDREIPEGMQTPSGSTMEAPECAHFSTEIRGAVEATCGAEGFTGDTYCTDCGALLTAGSVIPATGQHTYGEWVTTADGQERTCSGCGDVEYWGECGLPDNPPQEPTDAPTDKPADEPADDSDWIWITVTVIGVTAVVSVAAFLVLKKNKH